MFPEKQLAIGPAKAGIGFLDGISRSKELPSVEKLSRESTRVNTNRETNSCTTAILSSKT
jgi:hypothetical protein